MGVDHSAEAAKRRSRGTGARHRKAGRLLLHLVPIPFTKTFADYYTLGEFETKDYPSLVAEGQKVGTIAVPAVLAVFNWPRGSDRYRRIERFVERLFTNWDQFLVAPRHPKWRDVNLGATVPGWTRHIVAERMLERFHGPSVSAQEDISRDFQAFLNRIGTSAPQSQADREALFREFLHGANNGVGKDADVAVAVNRAGNSTKSASVTIEELLVP
jgi:hypothetical protein